MSHCSCPSISSIRYAEFNRKLKPSVFAGGCKQRAKYAAEYGDLCSFFLIMNQEQLSGEGETRENLVSHICIIFLWVGQKRSSRLSRELRVSESSARLHVANYTALIPGLP